MSAPLREAVLQAIAELDMEHAPSWASDTAKDVDKVPVGCLMCWPHDGSWPCITRRIVDDLRHALDLEPRTES